MTQREVIGPGTTSQIPALLRDLHSQNIFLLHGRSSFSSSGLDARITELLAPFRQTSWSDFSPNPSVDDLERGLTVFRKSGSDCLLSIGGGSVMDMAKLIKFFADSDQPPADFLTRNGQLPSIRQVPHLAVPTTSGSGSEATHFAVLYHKGEKYSVADPHLLPDAAIVDPELSASLPPGQTAASGMDAFSQAIESYWSINSTDESRAYSREAIVLVRDNLLAAVTRPSPTSRANMAFGAHLAGKAINISKTTAPHAISYTITTKYGVPHGHAVALSLGEMFIHNSNVSTADCNDTRGVDFVRARITELNDFFGTRSSEDTANHLRNFMTSIGLETRLDKLGVVSAADRNAIADGVNLQRLQNNPRRLTRPELDALIARLCGISEAAEG